MGRYWTKGSGRIFAVLMIALVSLRLSFGPALAESSKHADFKLGIIIPLTGDLADYGVSIRRGFELARSESPERFASIEMIFDDSRYDAAAAVTSLQKLRARGDINLYYAWGVSPTEAIIPIVETNKVPLLVETTLKESTAGKSYVVRAARTGERIARSLAHEISSRGHKKISLIVTDFTEVGITPDFRTRYSKVYGEDGHIGHAAQAYDVANLVADLYGGKGVIKTEDVIQRIEAMQPRRGATGELQFSNTVDGGKEIRIPVAMRVVRSKKIETISEDTGF